MAPSKWQFIMEAEDPWKLSALGSSIVELFLSILLLLGAAIGFVASRTVKFFGLEPPCTYLGCSHEGNRATSTLCLEDHVATGSPVDGFNAHLGGGKEDQGCSSDSIPCKKQNRISKHPCRQGIVHAHSDSRLTEAYPPLISVRSSTESNGGSGAEDHGELFHVSGNSEQEGKCEKTVLKCEDYQRSCSDNLVQKRWGRSKRPRRRDFTHAHSNGEVSKAYPALLSAKSHSESSGGLNAENHGGLHAEEGKCEEANRKIEDFPVHVDLALVHHNGAVEDAIGVCSAVALPNTEVDPDLLSTRSSAKSSNGFKAENHCEISHVSTNSEQERECNERDIRTEDLFDNATASAHPMVDFKGNVLVEDTNKEQSSNGKQAYDEELSVECLNNNDSMVDACNTEHSNMGLLPCKGMVDVYHTDHSEVSLLPCENNEYVIQFGSIIARTCIKDGDIDNTYVDYRRIDNEGSAGFMRIGECSLEKTGITEPSTDLSVLQFESNVFGDAIAAEKSLHGPMARNDITKCSIESSSAEVFEGTSMPFEERTSSTPPLEDNKDIDRTIAEDEQEEGLDAFKMDLQGERSVLAALEAELENERNAAEVATNEAMAMISRLQEEKSAMQMEVAQLQRMAEERANYDEHAMAVLTEILLKRETENMALEKEVELYREKLLAGNDGEPNDVWFKQDGNLSLQSHCKPLLSSRQAIEVLSPRGSARHQQSLTPLHHQHHLSGYRGSSHSESEELNSVFLSQNPSKRLRDFHANALGSPSQQWDDAIGCMEGGLHGLHDTYREAKTMGKCLPFAEDGGEVDGECGGFVPIHDVYEVHTVPNRSPPQVEEERRPPEPRTSRHITEFPPRLPTAKPIVSEEVPSTPSSMVQTTGWDIEKSFYTEDHWDDHDLRSLSLVSRDERRVELEEIKQLAMRLKDLEEDRSLLRETAESFKHRDAELTLLQEVTQHLRALRMVSFAGGSEGALSDETSIASPSRARPLKKRRYCSGRRQAQALLQHRKSL